MQCCSFGWVGERITNRAGSPGKAPSGAAFPTRFGSKPGSAAVDIVGPTGERIDRTRTETGARNAPGAGSCTCRPPGKGDAFP